MHLSLRAEVTQHRTRITRNSYNINTALTRENIKYNWWIYSFIYDYPSFTMDGSQHSYDSKLICCSKKKIQTQENTKFCNPLGFYGWHSGKSLKGLCRTVQLHVSLSERVPTLKKITIQKKIASITSVLPDNIYISPATHCRCNPVTQGKGNFTSQIGVSQLCRAKYHCPLCDLLSCFHLYLFKMYLPANYWTSFKAPHLLTVIILAHGETEHDVYFPSCINNKLLEGGFLHKASTQAHKSVLINQAS